MQCDCQPDSGFRDGTDVEGLDHRGTCMTVKFVAWDVPFTLINGVSLVDG